MAAWNKDVNGYSVDPKLEAFSPYANGAWQDAPLVPFKVNPQSTHSPAGGRVRQLASATSSSDRGGSARELLQVGA